jgi:hypothetical protein
MAANPDSAASVGPGQRLQGMKTRGLIDAKAEPAYRALIQSVYAPRLTAIGFNPAAGAHAKDAPDRQKQRQQLVELLAFGAHDPSVRATLKTAAQKYLAGDKQALDPGFLDAGLTVISSDGGLAESKMLIERALSTEDPLLRQAALSAAASSGHADVANYVLSLSDKRLRMFDRIALIYGTAFTDETRDLAGDWILKNYDKLAASGNGIFMTSRLPDALGAQCGAEQADRIEKVLGPSVRKANVSLLSFQRTLEQIRNCGTLRQAKSAEIAAALAAK